MSLGHGHQMECPPILDSRQNYKSLAGPWTASISKLCVLTFYAQKINAQLSCQTWCWHFVYVPCDSKDITQLDNRRLHIIERADKERGSRSWLAIQGPVFIDLRQVDRILACAGSSQNQDLTENCNIFFYRDQVLIDNPSLIMNTQHTLDY